MEKQTNVVVNVDLYGESGNAFWIMGMVRNAMEQTNKLELFKEYYQRATSSDYQNLLEVTKEYVVLKINDKR